MIAMNVYTGSEFEMISIVAELIANKSSSEAKEFLDKFPKNLENAKKYFTFFMEYQALREKYNNLSPADRKNNSDAFKKNLKILDAKMRALFEEQDPQIPDPLKKYLSNHFDVYGMFASDNTLAFRQAARTEWLVGGVEKKKMEEQHINQLLSGALFPPLHSVYSDREGSTAEHQIEHLKEGYQAGDLECGVRLAKKYLVTGRLMGVKDIDIAMYGLTSEKAQEILSEGLRKGLPSAIEATRSFLSFYIDALPSLYEAGGKDSKDKLRELSTMALHLARSDKNLTEKITQILELESNGKPNEDNLKNAKVLAKDAKSKLKGFCEFHAMNGEKAKVLAEELVNKSVLQRPAAENLAKQIYLQKQAEKLAEEMRQRKYAAKLAKEDRLREQTEIYDTYMMNRGGDARDLQVTRASVNMAKLYVNKKAKQLLRLSTGLDARSDKITSNLEKNEIVEIVNGQYRLQAVGALYAADLAADCVEQFMRNGKFGSHGYMGNDQGLEEFIRNQGKDIKNLSETDLDDQKNRFYQFKEAATRMGIMAEQICPANMPGGKHMFERVRAMLTAQTPEEAEKLQQDWNKNGKNFLNQCKMEMKKEISQQIKINKFIDHVIEAIETEKNQYKKDNPKIIVLDDHQRELKSLREDTEKDVAARLAALKKIAVGLKQDTKDLQPDSWLKRAVNSFLKWIGEDTYVARAQKIAQEVHTLTFKFANEISQQKVAKDVHVPKTPTALPVQEPDNKAFHNRPRA